MRSSLAVKNIEPRSCKYSQAKGNMSVFALGYVRERGKRGIREHSKLRDQRIAG